MKTVYLTRDLNTFPKIIGKWTGKDVVALGEPFETVVPDTTLKRIYVDPHGNEVKLFIGYFALQDADKEIFNSKYNDLLFHPMGSKVIKSSTKSSRGIQMIKFQYNIQVNKRLGYAWYIINGNLYSNQYKAKLATFLNITTKKRNNSAIVILTTYYDEETRESKSLYLLNNFTIAFYLWR